MNGNFSSSRNGVLNHRSRIVSMSDISSSAIDASSLARTKRSRRHEDEDASASQPRIRRKHSTVDGSSSETLKGRSDLATALRARLENCPQAGRPTGKSTDYFARCLEQLLLEHTSHSDEIVVSECTEQALNHRLCSLLTYVMTRRSLKGCPSALYRRAELQRVLGPNKVQEITSICEEISSAKLERAKMTCASCSSSSRTCCMPLKGKMPDAVRNLYFGTSLLGYWNNDDVSADSLTPTEWDRQYEQAGQNLKAYRTFMGQE